ncbi:MAG TPA: hypothetical protein VHC97_27375 [Thermoanaerobaculia bacterium]|jgi:hypothetical protein|nr:hypothetical protein [Thermoanaerobaculia bacterium]
MKRRIFLPLLAILPLAGLAPAGAIEFTARFESIKIDARPGETVNREFQLRLAPGGRRVHFKARAEDWWTSEDGSQSFYRPAGTLPRSCGSWISLNPVETAVDPGGLLAIRVTAAIPRSTGPGGYWCVLTVDEVPDPLDVRSGVEVRFLSSVSVGIFINLEPVERAVEIRDVGISGGQVRFRVCNTGNAPVGAEGRLELRRPGQASATATVVIPRATVLMDPMKCRVLAAALPGPKELPPGRYSATVLLDIGLDHYLGLQKDLEIGRDLLVPAR